MRTFKDVNHLPATPVHWTDPLNGHRIEWRTATVPFEQFLAQVYAYSDANNHPRPSRESVIDETCRQFASWACVGANEGYHAPARATETVTGRARACGGCGKRK